MPKIIILLSFFLLSCSINKTHTSQTPNKIILEKTGCMGPCPVYWFCAAPGSAQLSVTENHSLENGTYMAQLAEDHWRLINDIIANRELWAAANTHGPENLKDLPTTFLTLQQDGKTKKIKIYGKPPEHLLHYIQTLENILSELQWIREHSP